MLTRFYEASTPDDYAGMYLNQMSVLALPIKIIFGLIGPFPWTQFIMTFSGRLQNAYQLSDYILGIFQLGYLIAIFARWSRFSFRDLDYFSLMGFGIALTGFLSLSMHIGYIAEGIFFTLPWFFKQIGTEYRRYFMISFFILVLLNFVVVFTGSLGISNLWR